MMGKTGWVLLGVLFFGWIGSSGAEALAPPARGFQDLLAFVQALEEMPTDDFVRVASETPSSTLHEFHRALSELDPRHFEQWNEKLRLIPGPGFARSSNFWELHPRGPEMTVGFKPELRPTAFVSVVDFYESAVLDEPSRFQARAALTSDQDFERWMSILEKRDPDFYYDVLLKLQVMRTVGYLPDEEYRLIVREPPPKRPVGFDYGREPSSLPGVSPIRSSAELVEMIDTLTPEELRQRIEATSAAQGKRILEALKKRNPEKFQELVQKIRSRTKIGFSISGEPEIIAPPKKGEPRPSVGFRLPEPSCADLLTPPRID
jgi:hypothetical protein